MYQHVQILMIMYQMVLFYFLNRPYVIIVVPRTHGPVFVTHFVMHCAYGTILTVILSIYI